jgi:hypothetical protein
MKLFEQIRLELTLLIYIEERAMMMNLKSVLESSCGRCYIICRKGATDRRLLPYALAIKAVACGKLGGFSRVLLRLYRFRTLS